MTDWGSIARARGLTASGKELEALLEPLRNLEAVFGPLASDLPVELNPAPVFRAGTGE